MKFALNNVLPNPYRDLVGYGYLEHKIEKLMESIKATGYWGNTVGRVMPDGKLQISYGHHRLEALKRLFALDTEHEFIVKALSNDDMMQMMSRENDETYGGDLRTVMENVAAAVNGLASGELSPTKFAVDPSTNASVLRFAPSYIAGIAPATNFVARPYTVAAVARYLGYVKTTAGKTNPDEKVLAALSVLELIELGIYKKNQLNDERYQSDRGVVKVDYVLRETRDLRERAVKTLVKAKKEVVAASEQAAIAQAQINKQREAAAKQREEYDADVRRLADLTREADAKEVERLRKQTKEREAKEESAREERKAQAAKIEKTVAETKRAQVEAVKKEQAARAAAVALIPKKDSEYNPDYNQPLTEALAFLSGLPPKCLRSTVQDKALLKPGQLKALKEHLDEAVAKLQAIRSKLK